MLALLLVAVYGGRVAMARQAVQAAAADAARSASIARSATATTSAADSARATLANQDLRCRTLTVDVDASGFATRVGQAATVTATVSCIVDLTDLIAPGVPGTRTLVATATSPLDTFRERS
jgi:Flp pilus assembly protein TadG